MQGKGKSRGYFCPPPCAPVLETWVLLGPHILHCRRCQKSRLRPRRPSFPELPWPCLPSWLGKGAVCLWGEGSPSLPSPVQPTELETVIFPRWSKEAPQKQKIAEQDETHYRMTRRALAIPMANLVNQTISYQAHSVPGRKSQAGRLGGGAAASQGKLASPILVEGREGGRGPPTETTEGAGGCITQTTPPLSQNVNRGCTPTPSGRAGGGAACKAGKGRGTSQWASPGGLKGACQGGRRHPTLAPGSQQQGGKALSVPQKSGKGSEQHQRPQRGDGQLLPFHCPPSSGAQLGWETQHGHPLRHKQLSGATSWGSCCRVEGGASPLELPQPPRKGSVPYSHRDLQAKLTLGHSHTLGQTCLTGLS